MAETALVFSSQGIQNTRMENSFFKKFERLHDGFHVCRMQSGQACVIFLKVTQRPQFNR